MLPILLYRIMGDKRIKNAPQLLHDFRSCKQQVTAAKALNYTPDQSKVQKTRNKLNHV